MKIADLFQTRIEERIEPVIKVADRHNEEKLAREIGSFVVTPLIEKHLDDFLEHYTDTFIRETDEIGVWISGYFGSGKSHLAKIMGLLAENRKLAGTSACDRFKTRVPPDSPRHGSITRSLDRMDECDTEVLAFNINSVAGSHKQPLSRVLLTQYYMSRGYSGNLIYARVIESELDKEGKLDDLHEAVEEKTGRSWDRVQNNLSFYRNALYEAAAEVAPEAFPSPEDVEKAMSDAEQEDYNCQFLVNAVLEDIERREQQTDQPQRLMLVLDESGQWIEDVKSRLYQLQALVEEAAVQARGKIWFVVTTHGDMGSIYKEARANEADMKKIEDRFRCKTALTTENIEMVLEERLFKKTGAGEEELEDIYQTKGGVLRGVGELANVDQDLPDCSEDNFIAYYPFFPYHIHLIPEIVKSLRSKGGRGEQMSGSTRTLLAISQDVLRAGRRPYLDQAVGELVSFDEVYGNLAGEGEVPPEVRRELSRVENVVPDATEMTRRVAEVLYMIRELTYIPRSSENLARLLIEDVDEDVSMVLSRVQPELERLVKSGLVGEIGEEYEFLTGERRSFEEAVTTITEQMRQQERETGMRSHFIHEAGSAHWRDWLDSDVVRYKGLDFPFKLTVDGYSVPSGDGDVELNFTSPLGATGRTELQDLEDRSIRSDEKHTIFFLCGQVRGFQENLSRYLATKEVVNEWKGDPHRSEEARKLARDRESDDLPKLRRKVVSGITEGIRRGHIVFRGSSRALPVGAEQTPAEALREAMSEYWPSIYPKFDKVPVRVSNEGRAIRAVLSGEPESSSDVEKLGLYDSAGDLKGNCPLLAEIRSFLTQQQEEGRRTFGKDLLTLFTGPEYGWDANAVRVGVAALVREGSLKVLIGKKALTNPEDPDLVDALRRSRDFAKVEFELEEVKIPPEVLEEIRTFLIRLAKTRKIDEIPSALSEKAGELAEEVLTEAREVTLWAQGASFPLPDSFRDGREAWEKINNLTVPKHRVMEVYDNQDVLRIGYGAVETYQEFREEHAETFGEMQKLANQLANAQHQMDPDSKCMRFLEEYERVHNKAHFGEKEAWRRLQSLKSRAEMELEKLLDTWREEARESLDQQIQRLPEELKARDVGEDVADELVEPLTQLRDDLGSYTLPGQVANLPQQADRLVRHTAEKVREYERERNEEEEKPVRNLTPRDVNPVTRISSEEEWEKFRDSLDTKVKKLLSEGYEVELS